MDYDLEALYQRGYEIGVTGIKRRCPDDIYDMHDHAPRDAWLDGYKAGWREFRKQKHGYNLTDIHADEASKGRIWIDPKDQYGFQALRDCEGGTILCKLKVDGEIRIVVPKQNLTPEMGVFLAKAVAKAAKDGYRIRKTREIRPSNMDVMKVPPNEEVKRAAGWNAEVEALHPIGLLAYKVNSHIRNFHWHLRKGQDTEGYVESIRAEIQELQRQFNELYGDAT